MDDLVSHASPDFLHGGGETGELTRRFDWAASPIGSPETWPQTLRLAVRLLLTSQHPMLIWWGPDLIQFYNDAFSLTLGPERHPAALGQGGHECWDEAWDVIGPQIKLVMAGQGATWHEDQLVPLTRHGARGDAWWTYGYSPIHDDSAPNGVGGVFVVCNDVTDRHLMLAALRASEERLKLALDASQLVGIWEWDVANDRISGDARYARLHGLDPNLAGIGITRGVAHAHVHPDDRAAVAAEAQAALAGGDAINIAFRVLSPGGVRWVQAHGVRQADADGQPIRFLGATVDVTEGRAAEERLRNLFEQAPGFICILKGPNHVFELYNEAYARLLGGRDMLEKSVRDAIPELEGQGFLELLDKVYATGETFNARGAEIMLQRNAGGSLEQRFLDFVYQPIRAPSGSITGIFVQGHDITDHRKAEEHRQLLINELNHRVKNTLTTVYSVAQQTLRDDLTMAVAKATFMDRIMAISRTHNLLTQENWVGAELTDAVHQVLDALVPADRQQIDGPPVKLKPHVALALSMALHELATNAAKYGALSNGDGRIDIAWSVTNNGTQDRRLQLEWRETGGPRVQPPTRKGFGTRLIERGLAHELNGRAQLTYEPAGLVCSIDAPV